MLLLLSQNEVVIYSKFCDPFLMSVGLVRLLDKPKLSYFRIVLGTVQQFKYDQGVEGTPVFLQHWLRNNWGILQGGSSPFFPMPRVETLTLKTRMSKSDLWERARWGEASSNQLGTASSLGLLEVDQLPYFLELWWLSKAGLLWVPAEVQSESSLGTTKNPWLGTCTEVNLLMKNYSLGIKPLFWRGSSLTGFLFRARKLQKHLKTNKYCIAENVGCSLLLDPFEEELISKLPILPAIDHTSFTESCLLFIVHIVFYILLHFQSSWMVVLYFSWMFSRSTPYIYIFMWGIFTSFPIVIMLMGSQYFCILLQFGTTLPIRVGNTLSMYEYANYLIQHKDHAC